MESDSIQAAGAGSVRLSGMTRIDPASTPGPATVIFTIGPGSRSMGWNGSGPRATVTIMKLTWLPR